MYITRYNMYNTIIIYIIIKFINDSLQHTITIQVTTILTQEGQLYKTCVYINNKFKKEKNV